MSRISTDSPKEDAEMWSTISSQFGPLLLFATPVVTIGWVCLYFWDYSGFGSVQDTLEVFGGGQVTKSLRGGALTGFFAEVFTGDTIQKMNWFLFGDDVSSFLAISKLAYISIGNTTARTGHLLSLVTVLNVINMLTDLESILGVGISVVSTWGSVLHVGSNARWIAVIPLLSAFFDLVDINHREDKSSNYARTRGDNLTFIGVFYICSRLLISMAAVHIFILTTYCDKLLTILVGTVAFGVAILPFVTKLTSKKSCFSNPVSPMQHEGRSIIIVSLVCFFALYSARLISRSGLVHPYIETVVCAIMDHFLLRMIIHMCLDCTGLFEQVEFLGPGPTPFHYTADIADLQYGRGQLLGRWKHDLSQINTFMRYITHEMGNPMSSLALTLETLHEGVLGRMGSDASDTLARLNSSGGLISTTTSLRDSISGGRSSTGCSGTNTPGGYNTPGTGSSIGGSSGNNTPRLGMSPNSSYTDLASHAGMNYAEVMEAITVGRGSLQYISKVVQDMRNFQETLDTSKKNQARSRQKVETRGGTGNNGNGHGSTHTKTKTGSSCSHPEMDLPTVFDIDTVILEVVNSPTVLDLIRAYNVPKVTINHNGTGQVKTSLYAFKCAIETLLIAALDASVVHLPLVINVALTRTSGDAINPYKTGAAHAALLASEPLLTLEQTGVDTPYNGIGCSMTEAELEVGVVFEGDYFPTERIEELMGSVPWYATCVPGGQHLGNTGSNHHKNGGYGSSTTSQQQTKSARELNTAFMKIKMVIQPLRGHLKVQSQAKVQLQSKWSRLSAAGSKNQKPHISTASSSGGGGGGGGASSPAASAAAPLKSHHRIAALDPLPHTNHHTSVTHSNMSNDWASESEMGIGLAEMYVGKRASSLLDRQVARELAKAVNKFTMTLQVLHMTNSGAYHSSKRHLLRFVDPECIASGGTGIDEDDDMVEVFDFDDEHHGKGVKLSTSAIVLGQLAPSDAASRESLSESMSSDCTSRDDESGSACGSDSVRGETQEMIPILSPAKRAHSPEYLERKDGSRVR